MNWNDCVDLMLCLNLGTREDRRLSAWAGFASHGLEVERFAAVDKRWLTKTAGYESKGRYACGLSKRLALRYARGRCVKGLLLLEDDAVLHVDFAAKIKELPLPCDWAMLYLGCQHLEKPTIVAPGLVRIRRASSMHAVVFRASCLKVAMAAMRPGAGGPRGCIASDLQLAELQKTMPVYAPWPNLAWQRGLPSSIDDPSRPGPYSADGRQRWCRHAIDGLDQEMAELQAGNQTWFDDGQSRVWMHPEEWTAVVSRLSAGMRVLEWGSGGSTTALGQRVREVVSIEHDAEFAEALTKPGLPANVTLHVVPPDYGNGKIWEAMDGQFARYIHRGTECGAFDAVLVDGRARIDCARAVAESGVLRPGGWLFLHDWFSRPRYKNRLMELTSWYDLVEVVGVGRRGLAVFRRRG
jgi:hypothetical protein